MKMIIQTMTAMAFAGGIFSGASAAFATDTSQAIKLCDANPNCHMVWGKDNDGITITVGGKTIDCPKKNGPCTAIRTIPSRFNHIGEGGGQHLPEAHQSNGDGNVGAPSGQIQ